MVLKRMTDIEWHSFCDKKAGSGQQQTIFIFLACPGLHALSWLYSEPQTQQRSEDWPCSRGQAAASLELLHHCRERGILLRRRFRHHRWVILRLIHTYTYHHSTSSSVDRWTALMFIWSFTVEFQNLQQPSTAGSTRNSRSVLPNKAASCWRSADSTQLKMRPSDCPTARMR